MIDKSHQTISELLGAYALDAVEREEAEAVETHVRTCAACTAELATYREVAGLIANSGGDAPPELWPAISAQLEHADTPDRAPGVTRLFERPSAPTERPRTARGLLLRPWVYGAAAAVVAVVALGVQLGRLDHQVNQLQAENSEQVISGAAKSAWADSQARHVTLTAAHSAGPAVAEIAILPSGSAFLVNRHLPTLAGAQTYQLWGQLGDELVSLGLLGASPSAIAFHVDPQAHFTAFAVTVERSGGVVRSTHVPIAVSPSTL